MEGRVVVTSRSFVREAPEALEVLQEAGLETVIRIGDVPWQESDLVQWIADFDAAVAGLDDFTSGVIEAGARLRVIARVGAGYDNVDIEAASARGIYVTNAGPAMAASVADLAMGMILNLARHIPEAVESVRDGRWQRRVGLELAGRVLGLVGTGYVGREVGRRATAFGMTVLGHDVRQDGAWAAECGARYVPLRELLTNSDFVSLHLPLTPSTRGLIGAREMRLMRPGAYLINTSRGGIVDEAALLAALEEGRLAGAGLDVLEQEPPRNNDLIGLPSVLVTPHIGSATREAVTAAGMVAARNVVAVLAGHDPISPVNRLEV